MLEPKIWTIVQIFGSFAWSAASAELRAWMRMRLAHAGGNLSNSASLPNILDILKRKESV